MRLDGTELRNWDRRQFGTFTGYLPQEVELFPGTIKENVCRMRSDLPDEKVYEAAVVAGVHDMISPSAATATRRCCRKAARRCRAARSSASRSPARCSAIRR